MNDNKPFTEVLEHATDMLQKPPAQVTKQIEGGVICLTFKFPKSFFRLWIVRRPDNLHQVARAQAEVFKGLHTDVFATSQNSGDESAVPPIMLAELHRLSPNIGMASQRLIQSAVVADGETNYYNLVAGRLLPLQLAAA